MKKDTRKKMRKKRCEKKVAKKKDAKEKRRIKTSHPHRNQLRNYEAAMPYGSLKNYLVVT